MKKIAIIYHSGFGHTKKVAEHVLIGAQSASDVEAVLIEATDVTQEPTQLDQYDAMIFGAPTYMGSLSASFKAFMDATAGVWFTQNWKNKIAAGFTNSGSLSGDKFNSLTQLVTFASQHGMIWVPPALMNESSADDKQAGDPDCMNRIGSYLGLGTQSNNEDAEKTPPAGDLKSAEHLGKRVAEISKQFNG